MRWPIAIMISCKFLGPAFADPGPERLTHFYRATVVSVIDGDTIDADIRLGFSVWLRDQRIRFYDLDAPELPVGAGARDFLDGLIGGKNVILITEKDRQGKDRKGRRGRWLGKVYLDGKSINQIMIDAGFAVACTYERKAKPGMPFCKNVRELSQQYLSAPP